MGIHEVVRVRDRWAWYISSLGHFTSNIALTVLMRTIRVATGRGEIKKRRPRIFNTS